MAVPSFIPCPTGDVGDLCGPGGHCVNITGDAWICSCDAPWGNMGDLVVDRQMACLVHGQARAVVWSVCLITWLLVITCAALTAWRLFSFVVSSARRNSEIILLSMKCIHGALFVTTACLALSSPKNVVGLDLTTTVIYALASTFFWIEYKLFLTIPTLSSVTSIALAIAPGPMKIYLRTAPVLLIMSTFVSLGVVAMCFQRGKDPSPALIGSIHIELNGVIGVFLLGSHMLTMTVILRKFDEIKSSSKHEPDSNVNAQLLKLVSVESKIRKLRNETLFLVLTFPPLLILYGAIPVLRNLCSYFLPLAWSCAGLVTLRFIYMSHLTVKIHLKRARTDPSTTPNRPHDEEGLDGLTIKDITDLTPFNSSSASEMSPMAAISRMARRRKKRKPKFINAMTRVDEERTGAVTRVEEQFTVMDSNEVSKSANI